MGGTREGGLKAAQTLKEKDPDYFKKLRSRVKRPTGGKHAANGFDADPERARSAGAKGGRKSRRIKSEHSEEEAQLHHPQGEAKDHTDGGSITPGHRGARSHDQPAPGGGES